MENLLIIGWLLALVVYIALTHLYNWACRLIIKDNVPGLIIAMTFCYLLLNIMFFRFTYLIFQQL